MQLLTIFLPLYLSCQCRISTYCFPHSLIKRKRASPQYKSNRFDIFHIHKRFDSSKSKSLRNVRNRLLRLCCQPLTTPFIDFIISSAQYPGTWKLATVVPSTEKFLFWCRKLQAYCYPPPLSKIIEQIIHRHIYSYLKSNKLLSERNSRFCKNRPTVTSLLETTHKLYTAHDRACLQGSSSWLFVIYFGLIYILQQL